MACWFEYAEWRITFERSSKRRNYQLLFEVITSNNSLLGFVCFEKKWNTVVWTSFIVLIQCFLAPFEAWQMEPLWRVIRWKFLQIFPLVFHGQNTSLERHKSEQIIFLQWPIPFRESSQLLVQHVTTKFCAKTCLCRNVLKCLI